MSLRDDIERENASTTKKQSLGRIAELLERNGIDIDEIGAIKRVSLYQAVTKDSDTGEASVHDLTGIQFSPKWETGPEWPVIQQGPPVKITASKATKTRSGWPVAVVLPVFLVLLILLLLLFPFSLLLLLLL